MHFFNLASVTKQGLLIGGIMPFATENETKVLEADWACFYHIGKLHGGILASRLTVGALPVKGCWQLGISSGQTSKKGWFWGCHTLIRGMLVGSSSKCKLMGKQMEGGT